MTKWKRTSSDAANNGHDIIVSDNGVGWAVTVDNNNELISKLNVSIF